ncbi:MAG TPA: isoprenylcysteine carboxylmethyltransferase family protein [Candidatus Eremiobacteraceae bacterium]|nr:isoprenylcysteine carboxylmethyltransferase family protein [Candidatus Eremiobacteraceae bacterium]
MKANIVTLIVFAFALVLLTIHYAHEPWTAMRVAAVILGLPSLVLLIVARIELGGAFSVRPKAQALVTHGLYSRIRNPIYLFGTLTIVACFLYIGQPVFIFLLVVLVPLQMYRARQEAKILEAKFGEEYREYKARTWF